MKRNTVIVILVAVVAALFLVNPFKFFQGRNPSATKPPAVEAKVLDPLLSFAASAWQSPEDYILSCFEKHDIVFLGEFTKIRQQVQLVSAIIPRLAEKGIALGFEYALSDSQPDIDALLAAPSWDETRARAIVREWIVTWGYQEYIDIFRAAWQANRSLGPGARPFRLVGLSPRQGWEHLKTDRDARDPDTVKKIFAQGIPDAHMARIILEKLAPNRGRALVFCGTQRGFTRFRSREYEKSAASMKLDERRRAGNIVHDALGARTFTVMMHAPWPDRRSRTGLSWAAGGVIDALLEKLPPGRRQAGWDTAGTALGALAVTTPSYLEGYRGLTLADLCDGYIVQGPLSDAAVVTAIRDFVPDDEAARAVRDFPGPKPRGLTLQQVNQSILDDTKAIEGLLAGYGRQPSQ
jgi:hypothetical protein